VLVGQLQAAVGTSIKVLEYCRQFC